ncbi:MAG TPA: WYL domain-containing protein [Gemmatimonadales bacterium]|nr:WYL domain-containing protein [Gemmatimonadales bacterium]
MPETAADKLRRVLLLIPELADGKPHSVAVIAKRLGVDRQTLLRDLESLSVRFDDPGGFVEGVQIFLEEEQVALQSNHFLRPMRLTVAELGALELGLALLRSERPAEEHPVLDRARARLARALARLPDDPPPDDFRAAATGSEADAATLSAIRRGMRAGHKLAITYRASGARESSERTVCPYAPVFASGAWYLVAHCERSAGLRVFRLDRIESVRETGESYTVPADFALDAVVHEGKVFHGEPQEVVRVRYGPAVARWIAEREGRAVDPGGSLTLEHPLADEHWVVRHVLQYGADAEVLGPESAREAVRERLAAIVSAP